MNARTVFLYAVSLAVVGGYLLWEGHERRRIVADLDGADRDAVYESTIAGFRKLCVDRSDAGFEKYCDAQRDFLELFPECDSNCARLLAKVERIPTR
jgi:hypothetical protein